MEMICSKCKETVEQTYMKNGRAHKKCERCREKDARKMDRWRAGKGDTYKDYQRDLNESRRRLVLSHYGGVCICCNETHWQFLALDHKDGGGNAHRREIQQRGTSMIGWVIANNYPEMFEIRCHNCNQARGFYGACPHELERQRE